MIFQSNTGAEGGLYITHQRNLLNRRLEDQILYVDIALAPSFRWSV